MEQTVSGHKSGANAPAETMKARVRRVTVRLVTKEEMPRWIDLMPRHHYLGRPEMVGEALCYVATVDDGRVTLMGWASAALPVKVRDQWIGWSDDQRHRRLYFGANNVRYCILPGWNLPNLASRGLALNTRRIGKSALTIP